MKKGFWDYIIGFMAILWVVAINLYGVDIDFSLGSDAWHGFSVGVALSVAVYFGFRVYKDIKGK